MKPPTALAAGLLAAALSAAAGGCRGGAPAPVAAAPAPTVALPSGRVIALEVAATPEERAQGLMFRASMPQDAGMVFLFDRPEPQAFWMKNCHFPLDMIFTLADGTVTALLENVPPCAADPCPSHPAGAEADTVVEVNAGVASASGVSVGKRLVFSGVPGR